MSHGRARFSNVSAMSRRASVGLLVALTAGCKSQRSRGAPGPTGAALARGQPWGRSADELAPLRASIARLAPLHTKPGRPAPGEWLAEHHEPGQSFQQYIDGKPTTPTEKRRILVVQPLGEMTTNNARVLATITGYLQAFFGLVTRLAPPLSVDLIPRSARRPTAGYGEQLLTSAILSDVLAPRLPDDAVAYLAFTAHDLWPGDGWNFVFGEAQLEERLGGWSLARNGDTSSGEPAYSRALLRAMKIATHETGHMLGMLHCTAYVCNMAGVNSLAESDRHPLWLCPECLAKLSWATGSSPGEHLGSVREAA